MRKRRRSRVLGLVKNMSKSAARETVNKIVAAGNARRQENKIWRFGEFIELVYFPFYSPKWKASTRRNNVNRINGNLARA